MCTHTHTIDRERGREGTRAIEEYTILHICICLVCHCQIFCHVSASAPISSVQLLFSHTFYNCSASHKSDIRIIPIRNAQFTIIRGKRAKFCAIIDSQLLCDTCKTCMQCKWLGMCSLSIILVWKMWREKCPSNNMGNNSFKLAQFVCANACSIPESIWISQSYLNWHLAWHLVFSHQKLLSRYHLYTERSLHSYRVSSSAGVCSVCVMYTVCVCVLLA